MNKNIIEVTNDSFDNEVIKSDLPVLVDFWAAWCGPCSALAPIVDKVSEKFVGKVKFAKLNVDKNNDTSAKYNIRGIPTLLLFKNGKVIATKVGLVNETQLISFIDDSLK